jgi:hypothetical protein
MISDDNLFSSDHSRYEPYVRAMMEHFMLISLKSEHKPNPGRMSSYKEKAKVLYEALWILEETKRKGLIKLHDIEATFSKKIGSANNANALYRFASPEEFIATLGQILVDDYLPRSKDWQLAIDHVRCVQFIYNCGAHVNCIPTKLGDQLDIASFKLLLATGMMLINLRDFPKQYNHKRGLAKGNRNQKNKTINVILEGYKAVGAQRCKDEPLKKPFLLEGERISRNKLAGRVYQEINGLVTKENIQNYIKELHEKGKI